MYRPRGVKLDKDEHRKPHGRSRQSRHNSLKHHHRQINRYPRQPPRNHHQRHKQSRKPRLPPPLHPRPRGQDVEQPQLPRRLAKTARQPLRHRENEREKMLPLPPTVKQRPPLRKQGNEARLQLRAKRQRHARVGLGQAHLTTRRLEWLTCRR